MKNLYSILTIVIVFSAASPHDTLQATPLKEISVRYHFNLATWEPSHLPLKWIYKIGVNLFPLSEQINDRATFIADFLAHQKKVANLDALMNEAAIRKDTKLEFIEETFAKSNQEVRKIQMKSEEAFESMISDTLRSEKIPKIMVGPLFFPPVDFVFEPLPTILVTSPRNKIERLESVFLKPNLPPSTREMLETMILDQEELSAIVENIGGLSTFPNMIATYDLRTTIDIAGHEWLHSHLFFQPLGRSIHKDSNMNIINETTANIFGEELSNLIYAQLTGENPQKSVVGQGETNECPKELFCFNEEMRKTRLMADALLEKGQIEETEAYLEKQRQKFVDNGYAIRKLNQAFFAFHGTYSDSPTSISPINNQLMQLRKASSSLSDFIRKVEGIYNHEQFLKLLEENGISSP
ncbi:MAG: hypothetical protein DK304_000106 [Chloroflexi bacterium]|jgi:hypothetical protein|nr:MAG: hypothetical protein DK304_000106 [Chloroflexota bacterium]